MTQDVFIGRTENLNRKSMEIPWPVSSHQRIHHCCDCLQRSYCMFDAV